MPKETARLRDMLRSPAIQLGAYYLALGGLFWALSLWIPQIREVLLPEGVTERVADFGEALATDPSISSTSGAGMITGLVLALLGALALNAPLVWIYTVIMRQEGYERAFVRMLTLLPVVVAGVVQVVRGDLALAFALAGIVAAVRFRTTVKDLQNAVMAFAAIGIGLAAGTGSLLLAAALSVVVSYLAYAMWLFEVGEVEPSLALGHSGLRLSEALVPGETHKAIVIGDDDTVEPVHADDLEPLSESIERLADYVRADALRKKKKYNTLLLAYTDDDEKAKEKLEPILDKSASRWVFVDRISRNGRGVSALEYLLRLKKNVQVGRMIDELDCGKENLLRAAELKPIKGLRKRLT